MSLTLTNRSEPLPGPGPNAPQGLAWIPLDSLHILACERIAATKVVHLFPETDPRGGPVFIHAIQMNAPNECCTKVENLEAEAWYSQAVEKDKGQADVYKFHCTACSRCHVTFIGDSGGYGLVAEDMAPDAPPDPFVQRPRW